MYNIIQLNDMELSELQSIAKELGIQGVDTMQKDSLVYGILDEQAIAQASKRTSNKEKAANKDKESQPRKRSRISVKKEGDKVYTATQDKAQKLEANTPEVPAKSSPFNAENAPADEVVENVAPETKVETEAVAETKPAPKKRGRKPKAEKMTEQAAAQPEANAEMVELKEAENDYLPEQEMPAAVGGDDFIAIEHSNKPIKCSWTSSSLMSCFTS